LEEAMKEDAKAKVLLSQYLGETEVEEGSKICLFSQAEQPTKPRKSNCEKRLIQSGKMTRKVSVLHQRVNKKDWIHERRGKLAASTPKIPEVPTQMLMQERASDEPATVLLGKKYKPVAEKITPILGELPAKFCIERKIVGDSFKDMPVLELS
jgi:hypothetical protein